MKEWVSLKNKSEAFAIFTNAKAIGPRPMGRVYEVGICKVQEL